MPTASGEGKKNFGNISSALLSIIPHLGRVGVKLGKIDRKARQSAGWRTKSRLVSDHLRLLDRGLANQREVLVRAASKGLDSIRQIASPLCEQRLVTNTVTT